MRQEERLGSVILQGYDYHMIAATPPKVLPLWAASIWHRWLVYESLHFSQHHIYLFPGGCVQFLKNNTSRQDTVKKIVPFKRRWPQGKLNLFFWKTDTQRHIPTQIQILFPWPFFPNTKRILLLYPPSFLLVFTRSYSRFYSNTPLLIQYSPFLMKNLVIFI